jgi:hypothetical protein
LKAINRSIMAREAGLGMLGFCRDSTAVFIDQYYVNSRRRGIRGSIG